MRKNIILIFSVLVIVFLGYQQRWYDLLKGDLLGTYYPLSRYFLSHGDLASFTSVSSYPPGANLFFLLLPALSPKFYEPAFITVIASSYF
jgi:hypothetical protein